LKRKHLRTIALGLICLWAACGRSPKPNVVLVTIDTLRADYLGCYGHARPTSPNLDALAADAVLFEKVLCQSPETLPSHTSIMTGMHPRTHKVISHESKVDGAITTMAEVLSKRGYTSGAIVSSHVLDAKYGLDQGFATYRAIHYAYKDRQRELMHQREQDPTTDEALAWLRDHRKTNFFLWVHWFHPHRAYNPPPRYKQLFAGAYAGPAAGDQNDFAMRVWRDKVALPAEDIAYMRGLYEGEVAFTDVQVGRLLDELRALDLLDNTIVVITSDHGEILYEHEYYFGHDIALYDECTMVPLVVRIPGLDAPPRRVGGLVQTIDIFPTVLEALGIPCPAEVEGKSLVPLMRGEADRTVEHGFTETFPFPEKCPPRHAVRTETAKLVWREERPAEIVKQLYDLEADPAETVNLYPAGAQAQALDAILAAWIEPLGLHPAPIPSATESGRVKILKSLGYLD
jgi:arylsulfatase A-like enzyme